MNGKNSDWLPSDTTDRAGDNLSYLFDAYNLQKHVNFATRITNGFPKSCIDLVESNLQDHQVQLEPAVPLGSSDHLSIVGSLDITPPPSTHPSTHPVWTWSWKPENLEALRSDLAVTSYSRLNLIPETVTISGLTGETPYSRKLNCIARHCVVALTQARTSSIPA